MKNLTKFQKIALVVMVVCLVIGVGGIFLTMPSQRDATQEEIALYSAYDVLWENLPADGQAKGQALLSLCQKGEQVQKGSSTYESYTSETLGTYLYNCAKVDQILVSADGVVFITYSDSVDAASSKTVILAYGEKGLQERSVYVPETDILFYESGETIMVVEHFSNTQSGR